MEDIGRRDAGLKFFLVELKLNCLYCSMDRRSDLSERVERNVVIEPSA